MIRRLTTYAKPIILAILVFTCISIAAPRETHAWDISKVLAVPNRTQDNTNWCWAASARMVLLYRNGSAPTQCDLINWYYGIWNCPNWTGTVYMVATILRHYGLSQSEGFQGTLTMSQIQYQIDQYQPVVAAWWTSWLGGHMVVIKGYYRDNFGDTVYWNDPANGNTGSGSYQWFLKEPGHTWNYTVWKNR